MDTAGFEWSGLSGREVEAPRKLTGFLIYISPRGQSFYTQFSNKETNLVNLSGRGPHRGAVLRL